MQLHLVEQELLAHADRQAPHKQVQHSRSFSGPGGLSQSKSEPRRKWSGIRPLVGNRKRQAAGRLGLPRQVVVEETLGKKRYKRIVMDKGDWDSLPFVERVVMGREGGTPRAENTLYGKRDEDEDAVRQASASTFGVNDLVRTKTCMESKTKKTGAKEGNDVQALGEKISSRSEALMSGASVPVRSKSKASKRRSWRGRDKPDVGESDVKRTPPRIPLLFGRSSLHLDSGEFQVPNDETIAKDIIPIRAPAEQPVVIASSESRPITRDLANSTEGGALPTKLGKVLYEKENHIESTCESDMEDSIFSSSKEKLAVDSGIGGRIESDSNRLQLRIEPPGIQDITAILKQGDPDYSVLPSPSRGQLLRRSLSSNAFQEFQEAHTLGVLPGKNHSKSLSIASTSSTSEHQQFGTYQATLQDARTIPMQRGTPHKPTKIFPRSESAPGPPPLSALPPVPEGQIETLPVTPRNSFSEQRNDGTDRPIAKSRSSLDKYSLYPAASPKSPKGLQSPVNRNAQVRQDSGNQKPAALVTISNAVGSIKNASFPRPPPSPKKAQAKGGGQESISVVQNSPLPTKMSAKEVAVTPTKLARAEDMRENKMRQAARQKSQKGEIQHVEKDVLSRLEKKAAKNHSTETNPRPLTSSPAEEHVSLETLSQHSSKRLDLVETSTVLEESYQPDTRALSQISPIMLITEQFPIAPTNRTSSIKSGVSRDSKDNRPTSTESREIQLSPLGRSNLLKDLERAPSTSVSCITQSVKSRPIAERKPTPLIPDHFGHSPKGLSQWSSSDEMNLDARLSRLEGLVTFIATNIDKNSSVSETEDGNSFSSSNHWRDIGGKPVRSENGVNGCAHKG